MDLTTRQNLNFTNVKFVKSGSSKKKPHFWDISNFDFTYAFSELLHHNTDIKEDIEKKYKLR